MNADELTAIIDRRFETLSHLLELSLRQVQAIDESRMSDLMRILSDKQPPINELIQIGKQLASAVGEDPANRQWASDEDRRRCRERQSQCELMHDELLAIEADCEGRLTASRASAQEKLQRFDNGRVAANSYAQAQTTRPSGGSLDLSSD
ncbi:flagellar export chaperone FlgN [Rubripirellula reticaptiva]|uniref:FlgN protein n=1 Tax=Rubripirellula reticaptiva TaxID=2528013 RepID=A0A5C6FAF4_9BACT|nr:flagellar export chaperone FlgN [Rubripirellula reticaptiva]TWU57510.1 FlgN protein [Rubripirellula reticaptiva]